MSQKVTTNEDATIIDEQARIVIARCSAFIADSKDKATRKDEGNININELCKDFLEAISWLLTFEEFLSGGNRQTLLDLHEDVSALRVQTIVKMASKTWPKVANISSTTYHMESDILKADDSSSAMKITQLVQCQKDMHGQEVVAEKKAQEKHLADLSYLTESLKQTTLSISQAVKTQTVQLDMIQQYALENSVELEVQKKRLAERTVSAKSSVCSSFLSMLWIIATFVGTYVIVRLFPQPQSAQCPNR